MFSIQRKIPMDEWSSRESMTTWSSEYPSFSADLAQWVGFWTKQFTRNTFCNTSSTKYVLGESTPDSQWTNNVADRRKSSSSTVHGRQSLGTVLSEDPLRSPITGVCILPRDESSCVQQIHNNPARIDSQRKFIRLSKSVKIVEKLARIPNRIGDYVCRLCSTWFPDAFALAEHLCPRMANMAYPCDLCSKVSRSNA
ncbi:hypothetical protein FGIG_04099 [Fasciola gigantica]|uniref:C2H2-type domain-containing protein n=1 Tax=Fasciola gigantica TaxID=46835 RepID=A0A504YXE4_FASGI|nr:hypothetical protein FGIG_04099 [Fasciola gigantica]